MTSPTLFAAGSASFAPQQTWTSGGQPRAVAIGDLDGDGRGDMIVVTRSSPDPASQYRVFVYFQQVDGTLAEPLKLAGGNGNSVAVGDVNGDGVPDIVTSADDGVMVLHGLGRRLYETPVKLPTATAVDLLQVADLNNDGRDDVVAIDWQSANMMLFHQGVDGHLGNAVAFAAPHSGWNDLKIGDMNGDGRLDVVVSSMQAASGQQIVVVVQRADGTFDAPIFSSFAFGAFAPKGIGLVDVDGDGHVDIVATQAWNTPEARLIILFNRGLVFADSLLVSSYDSPQPVQIGDVNLDGLPDVVVAHGGWLRAGVYTRQSGGGLDAEAQYTIPYYDFGAQGLAIGDVNGDTRPDLVFVGGDGVTVLYNTTQFPATSSLGMDANGDGFGDILFQHTSGSCYAWLMEGASYPLMYPLGNPGAAARVVGAGDVNGDGALDLVVRDGAGNNRFVALQHYAGVVGVSGTQGLPPAGPNWTVAGVGDFDGDGTADILWREVGGYNQLFFRYRFGNVVQTPVAGTSNDWTVGAVADFDGDGKADIFWRNINGMNFLWHMDGPYVVRESAVPGLGADWKLVGVRDFNGDGKPDLLWRNLNGANGLWLMSDAAVSRVMDLPGVSVDWRVVGAGDYDRDGYADILWEQTATGTRVIWFLRNGVYQSQMLLPGTGDIGWQVVNPKSDR